MEEREAELIDYLDVLWRWGWLIAAGTLACVLVAGLVTWQLPRTYRVAATIDTGDLGEGREKDVERLVARVNTGSSLEGEERLSRTGRAAVTAQFKKPLAIDLALESESPGEAVKAIERVASRIIDDLNRLLRTKREEDEEKIEAVRAKMEGAKHEARTLLAELQVAFDRSIGATRTQLETIRAERERLRQDTALLLLQLETHVTNMLEATRERVREAAARLVQLQREQGAHERRAEELQRSLERLQTARSEVLRRGQDPAGVLLHTQLSGEIVAKETALAELEGQLTVQLPAQVQEWQTKQQMDKDRLTALEGAIAALRKASQSPRELGALPGVIYQAAPPGSPEVPPLDPIFQRVRREIPVAVEELEWKGRASEDQLKALEIAASVLRRQHDSERTASLEKVREAIHRVAGSSFSDGGFAESAVTKLETEIPERLRGLKRQAEELNRTSAGVRPARLVAAPAVPGAPIRPRLALNLALGFAVGLMGSVLLALSVDHVQQARRRDPTGRGTG